MDKSKLMLIVIIALLVLLLATVVGVTFYLLSVVGTAQTPEEFAQPVAPPAMERQRTMMDMIPVPIGDMIITSLAPSPDGRTGTIQMEAVAGIDGTAEQEEIDSFIVEFELRIAFARNIILDILGSHTYEEIRTVEGRTALGEEIRIALSERFETNLIANMTFPEWRAIAGR